MKSGHFVIVAAILQLALSNPPFYKELSDEEAERLASWTPDDKQPMWELSGQYEGDMLLSPDQRNGLLDTRLRWSNRELIYEFSPEFTEQEKRTITDYMKRAYARTCIKFRPRTAYDRDYVLITGKTTGCLSLVGRQGGPQELNLDKNGCIQIGVVAHEFMHALGFHHQQSASDRDNYVEILWQNIQDGYAYAFEKYRSDQVTNFGQTYDYGSVMHYEKYAFSKNKQPTIISKRDPNAQLGQTNGLSETDIIKINKMYNCA